MSDMDKTEKLLRGLLIFGALYFLAVSVVHMLAVKLPGLYIYFNMPSHIYQDRIISVLAFGWAVFLMTLAPQPSRYMPFVKALLVAGTVAICGLAAINLTTEFETLAPEFNPLFYWAPVAVLGLYMVLLMISYFRIKAKSVWRS